jgi:hypothetical protein
MVLITGIGVAAEAAMTFDVQATNIPEIPVQTP